MSDVSKKTHIDAELLTLLRKELARSTFLRIHALSVNDALRLGVIRYDPEDDVSTAQYVFMLRVPGPGKRPVHQWSFQLGWCCSAEHDLNETRNECHNRFSRIPPFTRGYKVGRIAV